MINDEADEVTKAKKPLKNNLESMKHSEFAFYYVHSLYYKCHKINLNCSGSYTDTPDRIKNTKA